MDYIKLASAGVVTLGAATAYYLLQGPDAPALNIDLDRQTTILPVSIPFRVFVLKIMSYQCMLFVALRLYGPL